MLITFDLFAAFTPADESIDETLFYFLFTSLDLVSNDFSSVIYLNIINQLKALKQFQSRNSPLRIKVLFYGFLDGRGEMVVYNI